VPLHGADHGDGISSSAGEGQAQLSRVAWQSQGRYAGAVGQSSQLAWQGQAYGVAHHLQTLGQGNEGLDITPRTIGQDQDTHGGIIQAVNRFLPGYYLQSGKGE
jgi:hypothetical protein